MIIGAIASAGGGLSAATLGSWTPDWSFSTPPVLRAGAGWFGTLDVWGGALVGKYFPSISEFTANIATALIYSTTTGHPAFSFVRSYSTLVLSSPYLSMAWKPHPDSDFPPLSTLQAKSLATAVLSVLFAVRVLDTHWLIPVVPPTNIVTPSGGSGKKSHKKKEKAQ